MGNYNIDFSQSRAKNFININVNTFSIQILKKNIENKFSEFCEVVQKFIDDRYFEYDDILSLIERIYEYKSVYIEICSLENNNENNINRNNENANQNTYEYLKKLYNLMKIDYDWICENSI